MPEPTELDDLLGGLVDRLTTAEKRIDYLSRLEDTSASGGGSTFPWYNVRDYGAVGDGATDDTGAINAAIAAMPATGGVLFFPGGQYFTATGAFDLSKPITVRGDGNPSAFGSTTFTSISQILLDHDTANLFEVNVNGCNFRDITLSNVSATAGGPTAGAGIVIIDGGDQSHYNNLTVSGFFINIEFQNGFLWHMDGCYILGPVQYGLKIAHDDVTDWGDFTISNCQFHAGLNSNATCTAIRHQSGGGMLLTNCKLDAWTDLGTATVYRYDVLLDLEPVADSSNTQIVNCSFENWLTDAIKVTGNGTIAWHNLVFNGLQFGGYGASGHAITITAANAGYIGRVIIGDNVFHTTSSTVSAIYIENLDYVYITNNIPVGWGDGIITQVNCTSVYIVNLAAHARYTSATAHNFPDATNTVVDFDTISLDPISCVTTGASWHFTIPTKGIYYITASVLLSGTSGWANGEEASMTLRVNGVDYSNLCTQMNYSGGATQYMKLAGSDMGLFELGDELDVRVYQASGGALTLHTDALFNFIDVVLLP